MKIQSMYLFIYDNVPILNVSFFVLNHLQGDVRMGIIFIQKGVKKGG